MENDHSTVAERRERWVSELRLLEIDIRYRRLQRWTEVMKVVLATLAVIAALSQASITLLDRWSPEAGGGEER